MTCRSLGSELMTVSMYSRACFSVASFTGSWWPCARTCRGSGGQGQGTSASGWPCCTGPGGVSPASPEVSGPGPQPPLRTCPSSRPQCSGGRDRATVTKAPAPPAPSSRAPPGPAPKSRARSPSVLSLRQLPLPPHRWPRGAGPPASGPSLCVAVGTSHRNEGT